MPETFTAADFESRTFSETDFQSQPFTDADFEQPKTLPQVLAEPDIPVPQFGTPQIPEAAPKGVLDADFGELDAVMRAPDEPSFWQRLRESKLARTFLGATEEERSRMIGGGLQDKGIAEPFIEAGKFALKAATQLPPPVAEEIRTLTQPQISQIEQVSPTAGGIAEGVRELAMGVPVPLSAFATAPKTVLAVFGTHYATSLPASQKAYDEAVKRGDTKEAASIATQTILGGALLAAGGAHTALAPKTESAVKAVLKSPETPAEAPRFLEPSEKLETPIESVTPEPAIVGMGGATPSEFQVSPKTPTGIKNATVDVERSTRGLPPVVEPARRGFGVVWDEAMAKVDRDPGAPERLVSELRDNPRAVTDSEDAILLHRQIDLQNEYGKATRDLAQAFDDGRFADVENEKLRVQQLSDQLLDLYNINKKVGTETGRGLNARKMMAYEDFSLARMELEKRAANEGAPLTDVQRAEIQSLHEKINETQRRYDEYVSKTEEADRQRVVKELVEKAPQPTLNPYVIQVAERIVGGLDKRADAARLRLREKMARTSAGVDPTILFDLAEIGASHLGHIGLDFAKWSARMIEDVGDWSKEHLEEVYKRSQKLIESEVDSRVGDKSKREGVRRNVTKQDKAEASDSIGQAIKAKIEAGEQGEITGLVQKLARTFVELGIKDRDELVTAVHEELKSYIPEISRRETMDAISGYGKYKQLTKDEISVQLRDLKGQMQQVAKLEDMQAGQAPAKTGLERRIPSNKERQLIKEVNELKKKAGFVVTDPEKQLKSALDSIKTRLQHQITDLALQISTKQKIAPEKRSVTYDEEANTLKSQRDKLKSEYDEIFGKAELTDEQRISMATKAVERSITEYERRIAEKDISPRPASKTPSTPALEAMKARREALQEQLQELRDLANPKKTPEERALQSLKARLRNETAKLKERLAAGDFSKKSVKPVTLDTEATKLKFENEKLKRQYREGLMKDRLAQRSTGRKIFDTAIEVVNATRAIMTSFDLSAVLRQGGFITFAHPVRSLKIIPDMLRAMTSQRKQFQIEQEILARKNYPLYQQSKLYLAEHGASLSKMEEAYMSRLADKIPGVAASQRAYTTFMNKLRADSFDAMAASLGKSGTVTPAEAIAISNFINVATGRGKLGLSDRTAVGLNTAFFAPKLAASRFQIIAGQPFYGGNARTRLAIAQEYGRFLAGAAVVYTLGSLAGAEIETDPRSSEFGKLRFGEERLDPLGGLLQATVLTSRLATGETKKGKGKIVSIRGDVPFGSGNSADVIARFLRTKLAPVPGTLVDLASGENVVGEAVTPLSAAGRLVVPISFGDIYQAMQNQGIPKGVAMAILSEFGMGLQSYPEH